MPWEPLHECKAGGCHHLTDQTYCVLHRRLPSDRKQNGWNRGPRSKISSTKRLYDFKWQKYSKAFLAANPWCALCGAKGIKRVAMATDHIIPHRGDEALFRDPDNHQGLCRTCHAAKSAKERGG